MHDLTAAVIIILSGAAKAASLLYVAVKSLHGSICTSVAATKKRSPNARHKKNLWYTARPGTDGAFKKVLLPVSSGYVGKTENPCHIGNKGEGP